MNPFFTLKIDTSLSTQPFDPVQFRLLLHQRLMELHKDKYPVLPFMNQQSSNSSAVEEGLDLTVSNTASRVHSDNDDDFFEEVEEEEEDMEVRVFFIIIAYIPSFSHSYVSILKPLLITCTCQ